MAIRRERERGSSDRRPARAGLALLLAAMMMTAAAAGAARLSLADDPPRSSALPSDPVFQALRTDGTTVSGRLLQMGPKNEVVLEPVSGADTPAVTIPLDRLVKLTRQGDPPASPPEGSLVLFPGGDRLQTMIGVSSDTALDILPPLRDEAPTPIRLDSLLAVILAPPADLEAQEALIARARTQPRDAEVLWLANGDRLSGGFLGLTAQKVSLQRDGNDLAIDRSGVVAIGFDPALASYPEPKTPYLELTFTDGSRLGVTDCRIDQGQILAKTRFGVEIHPPLSRLSRVHVRSDSVVYLSDRDDARPVFVGYLGEGTHRSTFGRNATLDGRTLRVGGVPYDRGLATQSRTLLAYKLSPGDKRFQSTVALDDRAGPLGSVVFRVFVDGKEKYASPTMTVRDAPLSIDLDIAGASSVILATEFADRGDVQDHADWIEARIIR